VAQWGGYVVAVIGVTFSKWGSIGHRYGAVALMRVKRTEIHRARYSRFASLAVVTAGGRTRIW
jgi:hypothetical protein